MKFGINFFPSFRPSDSSTADYYQQCITLAESADRLGFHSVKTVEHSFYDYGGHSPNPSVFLSALAVRTQRIRVMTGAVMGNVVGLGLLAARAGGRRGSRKGCELTMRDLVLAVEARRWRGWGAGMRREFPVSRGAECWERACEHDGRNTF
jgi:hypothetical protein